MTHSPFWRNCNKETSADKRRITTRQRPPIVSDVVRDFLSARTTEKSHGATALHCGFDLDLVYLPVGAPDAGCSGRTIVTDDATARERR